MAVFTVILFEKNMTKRYSLLALFVALYLVMFHVPMFSLNVIESTGASTAIDALLSGTSPYVYHLLLIGVGPFIAGGLIFHVISMGYRPWKTLSREGVKGIAKQKQITYRFALAAWAVMSLKTTLFLPEGAMKLSLGGFEYLVLFAELMAMYFVVKQVIKAIEATKLVSSGVTMLLGTNVLMLAAGDLFGAVTNHSGEIATWLIAFSLVCALVCILAILLTNKLSTKMKVFAVRKATSSPQVANIPLRINISGVMPVIYGMFIMMPVSILLMPEMKSPTEVFLEPLMLLFYIGLLFGLTLMLNRHTIDPEHQASSMVMDGLRVQGARNATLKEDNEKAISRAVWVNSIYYTAFLVFLLGVQAMWSTLVTFGSLNVLSYVGGIGLVIAVGLLTDMRKQYTKLAMSS